ncbi:MAG: hypothetical protein ACFFGP_16375 [Promethearchaeota archaeon]
MDGWFGVLLTLVALSLMACRLSIPSPQPTSPLAGTPTSAATTPTERATVTPTSAATTLTERATVMPTGTATRPAAQAIATPIREIPISVPGDGQERLMGSIVMLFQGYPQYCPQFQQYHVRFTWVTVGWNVIEPEKGRFEWELADKIVDSILACDGLELAFRVSSTAEWATFPPPPTGTKELAPPSTAPRDMQDYYDFMFALASHYKGKVTRYAIEEEAHAENYYWGGTPEQYMELLVTAHRAIHDADPDAIVQDSGLSSGAIGALYAHDLFRAGKTDEAGQFLRYWFADYAPKYKGEIFKFDTTSDVQAFFEHRQVQRVLTWVDLLWGPYSENYDVQQIHYLGPWDVMPQMLSWLHDRMRVSGSDKPIEFWEFAYGWDDMRLYDPQAHARHEAKMMAMAIGEGVVRALSWQFTDYAAILGYPGLVTTRGPRPAAMAFGVTAEKVNGTTSSARLDLGQNVWGYRYDRPSGTVYALWSAQPTKVGLPIGASSVIVTDITGKVMAADPRALDVGIDPIFVEVK